MSLQPIPIASVPEETVRVAQAAFASGNPYLTLRDKLGPIYQDDDFTALFPACGQPGLPPWRLALVTMMQFRENLSDRQAAEAVRVRIDWKYLLGLELADPGFDHSVLCEFRDRILAGNAAERLLEKLLERCRALGVLKARGKQRTDATHVLAAIRVLNRLELVAETLRAALNDLATEAPQWLRALAPPEWYVRYSRRIEDSRLPQSQAEREAFAQTVGEDGFLVLDAVDAPEAPKGLGALSSLVTLRQVWQEHYERLPKDGPSRPKGKTRRVRFKTVREMPKAAQKIESPYDPEARYRHKRDTKWTGYLVHVTETCEPEEIHLLTHVETTTAAVHEAQRTEIIEEALLAKAMAPGQHLVDAAYIDAELLVTSRDQRGIELLGPARPNTSWQTRLEGAYTLDQFKVDWEQQHVHCPQGKMSRSWKTKTEASGGEVILVRFAMADCGVCESRDMCTRAKKRPRVLQLPQRDQYEALRAAREWSTSEQGKHLYACRAGIEGTLSQGVRTYGLRRSRYRGLAKTHLQHVATAVAINVDRIVAWLDGRPQAKTRTSRFAALQPKAA
jgi:transposase